MILDNSEILDDTGVMEDVLNDREHRQTKTKKRVVPNNNQDKWLVYLLQNLNKASDLPWVEELLGKIEQSQDEFNAGKYRGAVFQMNYVAKETLTNRQGIMRSRQNSNVRIN